MIFDCAKRGFGLTSRYRRREGEPSDSDVECHLLGTNHDALRYVIERYRQDAPDLPRLVKVRDTHVRAEDKPTRYRKQDYLDFESSFRGLLERGDANTIMAMEVMGRMTDKHFVSALKTAAEGHEDKLKCFKLRHPCPELNFIILDYGDDSREVLFGWGQGKTSSPGTVFRSADQRMVRDFSNFYEVLTHETISEETSLRTLGLDDTLTVFPKWDQGQFNKLLSDVSRGPDEDDADLWIVTTFFINESDLRSHLIACLGRGVRLRVIFMNPANSALLYARFGIREDHFTLDRASVQLAEHIQLVRELPGAAEKRFRACKGTVEMRVSDIMPSGFAVHTKKWAVLGIMPARESYEFGPMIVAGPDSQFWVELDADAKKRWAEASQKAPTSPPK